MKFQVQNISQIKVYYAACGDLCGAIEIKPGAIVTIDDNAKDSLILNYNGKAEPIRYEATGQLDVNGHPIMRTITGDPIVVLGTAEDRSAPYYTDITASSTTWTLHDMKEYFSLITFTNSGSANAEVSFSGVVASTTAPPTDKIIVLKPGATVTITRTMNMERYFMYRAATATSVTISVLAQ